MKLYEILRWSDKHKPMLSFPSIREGLILDSDKWDWYLGRHLEYDTNKRYYISRVEFYPEFDEEGEVILEFSPAEYNCSILSELYTAIKKVICRCIDSGDFKPKCLIKQISIIEFFFKKANDYYARYKFDLGLFESLYKFLNISISHKIKPTCDIVRSLSVNMGFEDVFRLLIVDKGRFNIYGLPQLKLSKTRLLHLLTILATNQSNLYQSISIFYNNQLIADDITTAYLENKIRDCYKYPKRVLTINKALDFGSLVNKEIDKMVYDRTNRKIVINISDNKNDIYRHFLFDSTQVSANLLLGRNIENGSKYVDSDNQLVITCDDNNTIVDLNQFIGDSYILISTR